MSGWKCCKAAKRTDIVTHWRNPDEMAQLSLWDEAFQTLSEDARRSIESSHVTNHISVLGDILKLVEEKKRICIERRWRYTRSTGEIIVLRDLFDKVRKYVNHFTQVGDVIAQFDQAHTALAWGGVRFLLLFVTADSQHFGAVAEGVELVARLIARYAMFECAYLTSDFMTTNSLRNQLVAVYAAILRYLASARAYLSKNTLRRFLHGIGETVTQTAEMNLQAIKEAENEVEKCAKLIDQESVNKVDSDVNLIFNLLKQFEEPLTPTLALFKDDLEATKRSRILRWLSTTNHRAHYRELSKGLLTQSGSRLLGSDGFRYWRCSSSSSLLWLHGSAGCGKTGLMTNVLKSIFDQVPKGEDPSLAFFYCGREKMFEFAEAKEITGSLLKQIATSGPECQLQEVIRLEYKRKADEAERQGLEPEKMDLDTTFEMILHLTTQRPTILVLDALDEIEPSSLFPTLDILSRLLKETLEVLKIVVSSRDERAISNWFEVLRNEVPQGAAWEINIQPANMRDDVKTFIESRVQYFRNTKQLLFGNVSDSLYHHICDNLVAQSDGMMLYASLHLKSLAIQKFRNERDLRKGLTKFPNDLSTLYENMYNQISELEPFAKTVAEQTFLWLLHSRRALTAVELISAAVIDPFDGDEIAELTKADILDFCSNFVVLDIEMDTFRFVHHSAVEFLQNKGISMPVTSNMQATKVCLAAYTKLPLQTPCNFREYAACYWQEHFNRAEKQIEVVNALREFMFGGGGISSSYFCWLDDISRISEKLEEYHPLQILFGAIQSESRSPLFTICTYGLSALAHDLDGFSFLDLEDTNKSGAAPIYLAARSGSDTLVEYLIRRGVSVNVEGGHFEKPLLAASFFGHSSIVRRLLEAGAPWEQSKVFSGPLQAAIAGGHIELSLELLKSSITSNIENYNNAIKFAAYKGKKRILESLWTLSQRGARSSDEQRKEAIQASLFGCRGVCSFNQVSRDEVNATGGLFVTYLQAAALGGNGVMVKYLLEHGAEIDLEGRFGTPLRAAAISGHELTVILLVQHGANINMSSSHGDVLQAAAVQGYTSIMTYLLSQGADPDGQCGEFRSPLQAAAFHGHKPAVELLLEWGANPTKPARFYHALDCALAAGQSTIAKLLIDRDILFPRNRAIAFSKMNYYAPLEDDLDNIARWQRSRNDESSNPISKLDVMALEKIAPHLPAKETLDNLVETTYSAGPVELAARCRMGDVCKSLLNTNISAFERLAAASVIGDNALLSKLLVENSDQLDVVKRASFRAIYEAARNGHKSTIHLLLSSNECLEREKLAARCYQGAIPQGHYQIAEHALRLLDTSATEARKWLLQDTLQYASLQGQLGLLKFCLDLGATEPPCNLTVEISNLHKPKNSLQKIGLPCEAKARTFSAPRRRRPLEDWPSRSKEEVPESIFEHIQRKRLSTPKEHVSPNYDLSHNETFDEIQALYISCRRGDGPVVQALLDRCEAAYDVRSINTCFAIALQEGHLSVLEALRDRVPDLLLPEEYTLMALRHATLSGDISIFEFVTGLLGERIELSELNESFLLAAGAGFCHIVRFIAKKSKLFEDNKTLCLEALHCASFHGRCQVVELLIDEGADYTASGLCFSNPLHAVFSGFQYIYRSTESQEKWPLGSDKFYCAFSSVTVTKDQSVTNRYSQTIEFLLCLNFDPNLWLEDLGLPLHAAALLNMPSVTKTLIEKGANFPKQDEYQKMKVGFGPFAISIPGESGSPLDIAMSSATAGIEKLTHWGLFNCYNLLATIRTLLNNNCAFDLQHPGIPEILQVAVILEDKSVLDMFILKKVGVDNPVATFQLALHEACSKGQEDIAQCLLALGADTSIAGDNGSTCLHAATSSGNLALVQLLLKHEVDLNIKTDLDEPLRGAACKARSEVFELLMQAGAKADADVLGLARYHKAPLDTISKIVQGGVDPNPNLRSEWRWDLPLIHEATKLEDPEFLSMLIKHGAKLDTICDRGQTPLCTAIETKNVEIVRILLDAGADMQKLVCENFAEVRSALVKCAYDSALAAPEPRWKTYDALTAACERGGRDVAELLISYGVDVHQRALDAVTPKNFSLAVLLRVYNPSLRARD